MNTIRAVFFAWMLQMPFFVWADEPNKNIEQCPQLYPLDGLALSKVPTGWGSAVRGQLNNRYTGILEGPPEQLNEIKPRELIQEMSPMAIYNLNPESKTGYALMCTYGGLGEVILYKTLPAGLKWCTVKYKPDVVLTSHVVDFVTCK